MNQVDLSDGGDPRRWPRDRRRGPWPAGPTGLARGHGLGCRPLGRLADRGRSRPRRTGPAGVPVVARAPPGLGQLGGADGSEDRRDHRRSAGRHGSAATTTVAPTGMLHEGASKLVTRHAPEPTREWLGTAIEAYCRSLLAYGIVAVHDLAQLDPGRRPDRRDRDRPRTSRTAGRLPIRVHQSIRTEALDLAIERGLRSGAPLGESDRARFGWLKIFGDGSLYSRTAYLLEPWEVEATAERRRAGRAACRRRAPRRWRGSPAGPRRRDRDGDPRDRRRDRPGCARRPGAGRGHGRRCGPGSSTSSSSTRRMSVGSMSSASSPRSSRSTSAAMLAGPGPESAIGRNGSATPGERSPARRVARDRRRCAVRGR